MKSRPDPQPMNFDPRGRYVSKRTQQLAAKLRSGEPIKASDKFSQEDWLHAVVLRAREERVQTSLVERAFARTTPVLSAPESDRPVEDLIKHVLSQPEIRALWRALMPARGQRGFEGQQGRALALLFLLAWGGLGTHARGIVDLLRCSDVLREGFAQLEAERRAFDQPDLLPAQPLDIEALLPERSYEHTLQVMHAIARDAAPAIWQVNWSMMRALSDYHPGMMSGWLVDSFMLPAWAQQVGSVTFDPSDQLEQRRLAAREAQLRKRVPQAGFRMMQHTSQGKIDIGERDRAASIMRHGRGKSARGMWETLLINQQTGLAAVAHQEDLAMDEPLNLFPTLDKLFGLAPDLPLDWIACDSSWDEDPSVYRAEVDYGAHLIARLHPSSQDRALQINKLYGVDQWKVAHRSRSVIAISSDGRVNCRHNRPCVTKSIDVPNRQALGLTPGTSAPRARSFRVRAQCTHPGRDCCGVISVSMALDWSRLAYYPHHPEGLADRWATRMAALARLNQAESYINRLRSKGIGATGAARHRFFAFETTEALIALACTLRTAFTLADQRQRRGVRLHEVQISRPQQHQQHRAA